MGKKKSKRERIIDIAKGSQKKGKKKHKGGEIDFCTNHVSDFGGQFWICLIENPQFFFYLLNQIGRTDLRRHPSVMNNDFIVLVVISPSLNFTDDTRKPSLSEKLLSALGVT